jgi:hypothetical protein
MNGINMFRASVSLNNPRFLRDYSVFFRVLPWLFSRGQGLSQCYSGLNA